MPEQKQAKRRWSEGGEPVVSVREGKGGEGKGRKVAAEADVVLVSSVKAKPKPDRWQGQDKGDNRRRLRRRRHGQSTGEEQTEWISREEGRSWAGEIVGCRPIHDDWREPVGRCYRGRSSLRHIRGKVANARPTASQSWAYK